MTPAPAAVVRWLTGFNRSCAIASGVALLLMMVVGAVDVIGTNLDIVGLDSRPLPAAFEFMETMMVVSVFLALSLGQARRIHIRVEVLVNLLPGLLRASCDVLQHVASFAFFVLIAWYGWRSAYTNFLVGEYAPGVINFPVWPARIVLAFGASLMALQCLLDVAGVFVRRLRP